MNTHTSTKSPLLCDPIITKLCVISSESPVLYDSITSPQAAFALGNKIQILLGDIEAQKVLCGIAESENGATLTAYRWVSWFSEYHTDVISYCRLLASREAEPLLNWLRDNLDFNIIARDFVPSNELLTEVYAAKKIDYEYYDEMVILLINHLVTDAYHGKFVQKGNASTNPEDTLPRLCDRPNLHKDILALVEKIEAHVGAKHTEDELLLLMDASTDAKIKQSFIDWFSTYYCSEILAYCRMLANRSDQSLNDWLRENINFDVIGKGFTASNEILTDVYVMNNNQSKYYDEMIVVLIDYLLNTAPKAKDDGTEQAIADAYEQGYKQAQADIRKALGL